MSTINTTVVFTLRDGSEIKHESFFASPKDAHKWATNLGEKHDVNEIFSDKEIVGYTFTYAFSFVDRKAIL